MDEDLINAKQELCSYAFLSQPITDAFTHEDRCQIATLNCETAGLINFFKLYYCTLHSNLYVYLPLSVSLCMF